MASPSAIASPTPGGVVTMHLAPVKRTIGGSPANQITTTSNAPSARPPRGICLPPSEYMPSRGTVFQVSATKNKTDSYCTPRSYRSAALEDTAVHPERISSPVAKLHTLCRPPPGTAPEPSESCKFSPDEQKRLCALRARLVSCSNELQSLQECILDEGGVACGLPQLREAHRVRMAGQTFSIEDARRDFCNDWLSEKMRKYAVFIDQALTDDLDSAPVTRKAMDPVLTHPLQVASDAGISVDGSERGIPDPSTDVNADTDVQLSANARADVVALPLGAANGGVGYAGGSSLATGASLMLGPMPARSSEVRIQPSKVFGFRRALGTL